jgi:hypothetical protein
LKPNSVDQITIFYGSRAPPGSGQVQGDGLFHKDGGTGNRSQFDNPTADSRRRGNYDCIQGDTFEHRLSVIKDGCLHFCGQGGCPGSIYISDGNYQHLLCATGVNDMFPAHVAAANDTNFQVLFNRHYRVFSRQIFSDNLFTISGLPDDIS